MTDAIKQTAATERDDVLAYLARRKRNCETVAGRMPEFSEDAGVQSRQLSILIDEIAGGLHEGEAAVAASRPTGATDAYPFTGHRTLAEAE